VLDAAVRGKYERDLLASRQDEGVRFEAQAVRAGDNDVRARSRLRLQGRGGMAPSSAHAPSTSRERANQKEPVDHPLLLSCLRRVCPVADD
jgi:hypothetical protein